MSDDRAACAVAAALLRQGRWLGALALVLTAAAAAGLVWQPERGPWWSLALLLGVAALACTVRVDLDARLFERLAGAEDVAALDRALVEVAGMPAHKSGRDAAARIQGAVRWLRRQGMLVAAQAVVVVLAGAA